MNLVFWLYTCFGGKESFADSLKTGKTGGKWPFLALFAPWGPDVELGTKHFSDESCVLVIYMFWWQRQFRGQSQNGQKGWKWPFLALFAP